VRSGGNHGVFHRMQRLLADAHPPHALGLLSNLCQVLRDPALLRSCHHVSPHLHHIATLQVGCQSKAASRRHEVVDMRLLHEVVDMRLLHEVVDMRLLRQVEDTSLQVVPASRHRVAKATPLSSAITKPHAPAHTAITHTAITHTAITQHRPGIHHRRDTAKRASTNVQQRDRSKTGATRLEKHDAETRRRPRAPRCPALGLQRQAQCNMAETSTMQRSSCTA